MSTSPSFDPRLSHRLDRLIVQIELGPPAVQRLALRLAKRALETRVPAFGRGR